MSESFLNELAEQLKASQENNSAAPAPEVPVAEATQTTQAVSEPVAETKTEVPAQPATVEQTQKTEPTPVEKQWWEEESVSTQKADPVASEKGKEETPQIDLDEDLKLLLEYKKSGKTLADFVNEYKVDDYKEWTDEKFVKEGMKQFMNLTEEEREQAEYEFDSASVMQKKQWADHFKKQFDERNQSKLKQLTESNSKAEEYQKSVAAKYNADLDNFSKEVVGKELYGLKITDEMSNDLKSFIDKEFTLQNEDGSFDIAKMYSIGLWLKYGKDLVKANITKAKNEGREQVIKEVTNPSKNMTGGSSVVGSGLEAAQDAFNSLFQA